MIERDSVVCVSEYEFIDTHIHEFVSGINRENLNSPTLFPRRVSDYSNTLHDEYQVYKYKAFVILYQSELT